MTKPTRFLRRRPPRYSGPLLPAQEESTAVAEQSRVKRIPDTRSLLEYHWGNARRQFPHLNLGELPESLLKEQVPQRRRILDPNSGFYDEWENLYTASLFPFVIGTISQQIIPANPRRTYLLIQNKSAATMLVNFGQGATAFAGVNLLVGESLPFAGGERGGAFCPSDSVNIVGGAANSEGVLIEGVKLNIGTGID